MERLWFTPAFLSFETPSNPLGHHVNQIAHFARRHSAIEILQSRFGYCDETASRVAARGCGFLERGLEFFHHYENASRTVSPLLLYYSFANLASAAVFFHDPDMSIKISSHGARDISEGQNHLDLDTPILAHQAGLLKEWMACLGAIPTRHRYSLLDMFVNIPFLGPELKAVFKIEPILLIAGSQPVPLPGTEQERIRFEYRPHQTLGRSVNIAKSKPKIHDELNKLLPDISRSFSRDSEKEHANTIYYISHAQFSSGSLDLSRRLNEAALALSNLSGEMRQSEGRCINGWHWLEGHPLLPCAAATLMTSFFLSSISRYNPNCLAWLEADRMSLLVDTFLAEAPYYFIPFIRNVLYREEMLVRRIEIV